MPFVKLSAYRRTNTKEAARLISHQHTAYDTDPTMADLSKKPIMLRESANPGQEKDIPTEKLKLNFIYVVGPPGAGKGTLCTFASSVYDYCHLSVGDYLRDLCRNPTAHPMEAFAGQEPETLATTMRKAELLSAEQIVSIVRYRLEKLSAENGQTKFIIDGFPRTLESAKLFEKEVSYSARRSNRTCWLTQFVQMCAPVMWIVVSCDKDVAEHRFIQRNREVEDSKEKFLARYAQFEKEYALIGERYGAKFWTVGGT